MDTLDYILKKFNLSYDDYTKMPMLLNISRIGMASLFEELGFKVGAEVGTEQGEYAEALLRNNDGLKLYCIDPWQAYRGYRDHVNQEKLDRFYEATKEKTRMYNCEIIKKFSMDAVKEFEDESLDFVYIDANHNFQNCTNDIAEWSKKVRVGGIVSGHDFVKQRKPSNMHVYESVQGFTQSYAINPWFVTEPRVTPVHEARSWLWVKAPYIKPGKHRE